MSAYTEEFAEVEGEQVAAGPELPLEEMLPEVNVGVAERIASVIGGAAMLGGGLYFATHRRPISSALMGLGAGMLLNRGITGHCNLYEALDINTAASGKIGEISLPKGAGISVEESVIIDRPASELYAFWRNLRNLPRIMRHLERVDVVDEKKSRWVAQGPGGQLVEWEAEITHDRPDELIAWQTTGSAQVPSEGSVRFRPASGHRGTIVEVMLQYHPPGGKLAATIAKLFRREPAQEIREDLQKFKAEMETGEVPTAQRQVGGTFGANI